MALLVVQHTGMPFLVRATNKVTFAMVLLDSRLASMASELKNIRLDKLVSQEIYQERVLEGRKKRTQAGMSGLGICEEVDWLSML